MMSSSLLWFSGVVAFCSLATPTLCFSYGGSHASCQEMIPGHIRAHPLDPQHSYVIVHTSSSSYLPGQLITVTVRSSRDFMGFLLQARSGGAKRRRYGRGAGIRSRRLGPLLEGGSWILTPPGTHTLRCLSDGDTITHSDKQLKRNLSFVWRAPDKPQGDVRFHITVVQSYFIYWAGVESAVVRDGSRSVWSTPLDGTSTVFSLHEENVTALPALEAISSNKQTNGTTPAPLEQPIKTNRGPQTLRFLDTGVGSKALKLNNSVTLTHHAGNTTNALGSNQNDTKTTPESFSKVSATDPVSHTKDPRSFLPPTSFTSSADDRKMDTTTTVQPSAGLSSPSNSLVPFFPQIGIGTQMKDPRIKSQDPVLSNQQIKDTTLILENTTATKFETHDRSEGPDRNVLPQFQTGTVKAETRSSSQIYTSKHQVQTSKPDILFQSKTSHISSFPKTSPPKTKTSLPKTSKSPPESSHVTPITKADLLSLKPEHPPGTSPPGPKTTLKQTRWSQTTMSPSSSPQPPSVSSFHRSPRSTPTQTQTQPSVPQRDQSEIPAESLKTPPQPQSQPRNQTGRTSSAQPVKPLLSTLRSDPVFTLETDPKPQTKIQGTTSVFGFVTSVTSSPTFTTSNHPDSDPLHVSSAVYPLQTSEDSSMHPSFSSTSPTHSSSSFPTNPALSALLSPSPISTPRLPSAHLSSTKTQPSTPTSSTIRSSNSSNHPSESIFSSVPASTSPSLFNSSQCVTCSNVSPPSTSTLSTGLSLTSSFTSSSNPTSLSVSSPSFSSTSTSTPSPFGSSSSSFMSPITTPHPGPFSSHHFLQTSKKPTEDQKLVFHLTSSDPEPNLSSPTQRTRVHPNPKPFPNHRLNHGQEIKPSVPNTDAKPKMPSVPSEGPDKKGKYPDINPRHSAWELGMLLGCAAGLGMVLVVGVRYVYRQACGRRTVVTLNDREREYERGGRGLIQVQECGDLVRVRKIRENSFVLLTEYDVLAPPGD